MPHSDNFLEPKNEPMNPDGTLSSELPPRDAHKQGLHRTMTLGGQYATRNYTIKHLQDLKGKTVLTETMDIQTNSVIRGSRSLGGRSRSHTGRAT